LSKLERESIYLNQIQKEILIGTILGEASLERNKKSTHNTSLRFDQTFPTLCKIYNLTGSGPKVYIKNLIL
jgi:hypothetical protein